MMSYMAGSSPTSAGWEDSEMSLIFAEAASLNRGPSDLLKLEIKSGAEVSQTVMTRNMALLLSNTIRRVLKEIEDEQENFRVIQLDPVEENHKPWPAKRRRPKPAN